MQDILRVEGQTCLSWIVEVACVVGDVIELGGSMR